MQRIALRVEELVHVVAYYNGRALCEIVEQEPGRGGVLARGVLFAKLRVKREVDGVFNLRLAAAAPLVEQGVVGVGVEPRRAVLARPPAGNPAGGAFVFAARGRILRREAEVAAQLGLGAQDDSLGGGGLAALVRGGEGVMVLRRAEVQPEAQGQREGQGRQREEGRKSGFHFSSFPAR